MKLTRKAGTESKNAKEKLLFIMDGSTYSDDIKFKTLLDMLSDTESKYHAKQENKQLSSQ